MKRQNTQPLPAVDLRQTVARLQQLVTHMLGVLEVVDAIGANASAGPVHISAAEFCRREHISTERLRAYMTSGMPHHRDGKAIRIDVAKASEWLTTNLETPAVKQAVGKALSAARAARTDTRRESRRSSPRKRGKRS